MTYLKISLIFLSLFLISFNSFGFIDRVYHSNGQIKHEQNYSDDQLNGESTFWFENGQKSSEKHYNDGKLNGKSTFWDVDGLLDLEKNYIDGKLNGKSTFWHENGQKSIEGLSLIHI